jgi:hypothetical protein
MLTCELLNRKINGVSRAKWIFEKSAGVLADLAGI